MAETAVTVEFLPEESEQTVEVTILDDDFVEPMTEEFFGVISPGRGVSISRGSTAIRILEDDSKQQVKIFSPFFVFVIPSRMVFFLSQKRVALRQ